MLLAAAQTQPIRGDIQSNLNDHYRWVEAAAEKGASLIVFPEMSISGYEREDAPPLAFEKNDQRLENLRQLATRHQMVIVAGAPVKMEDNLFIGSFIFYPDGSEAVYTKQFLHTGEEITFQASLEYNPVIRLENQQFSLAICADINNALHAENAHRASSSVYIASIFFSPNGIPEAYTLLSNYARKYQMTVLMANYGGPSWGMDSGGRSACWNPNGELIAALGASGKGLLLVDI